MHTDIYWTELYAQATFFFIYEYILNIDDRLRRRWIVYVEANKKKIQ